MKPFVAAGRAVLTRYSPSTKAPATIITFRRDEASPFAFEVQLFMSAFPDGGKLRERRRRSLSKLRRWHA
jgi:hypothetical protein